MLSWPSPLAKIVLEQQALIQRAAKTLFLFTYTDYKTIFIPVVSLMVKYLFRAFIESMTLLDRHFSHACQHQYTPWHTLFMA
jgi:hypothetical protein